MMQNYPNPFNPQTTIIFRLPENKHVTLTIYDITGREVTTLVDGYQYAGEHSVIWSAVNMPTGVYFYRLVAGSYTTVRRMLLVK